MEELIELKLTPTQIKNILSAYERIDGNSPFFRFNSATQAIVDYLRESVSNEVGGDPREAREIERQMREHDL